MATQVMMVQQNITPTNCTFYALIDPVSGKVERYGLYVSEEPNKQEGLAK